MRAVVRRISLSIVLVAASAYAADDVPEAFMLRFNELALQADRLAERDGPRAAIRAYEDALNAWGADYGRIHLRLGVLYQKLGQAPEAARHFADCRADQRVDELDRETICTSGFEQVAKPLLITGLPDGGKVVVLEPSLFAGAIQSGDALPLGNLKLVVEVAGHEPNTVDHAHDGAPFAAEVGLVARRRGSLVPDAFVGEGGGDDPPDDGGGGFVQDDVEPVSGDATRWPAYTAAGLGVALVGAGVTIGLMNRGELDDVRSQQRAGDCAAFCAQELTDAENTAVVADALWISGAVVAASSVLWWYLFDGSGE